VIDQQCHFLWIISIFRCFEWHLYQMLMTSKTNFYKQLVCTKYFPYKDNQFPLIMTSNLIIPLPSTIVVHRWFIYQWILAGVLSVQKIRIIYRVMINTRINNLRQQLLLNSVFRTSHTNALLSFLCFCFLLEQFLRKWPPS